MVLAVTTPSLLIGWYNGRDARPLQIAGLALYFTSIFAAGAHRRWKAAHDGASVKKRWRFSMAELILIVTGIVAWVGFSAADHRQSQQVQREREKLSTLAAPILGPEGRLGFESNGDVSIAIIDRSFNDDRLAALASLIEGHDDACSVQSLMFGTTAKTAGAPLRWPGVTDSSVDLILQWNRLEWLFIEGTDITPAARQKLIALPALHEVSRNSLGQP